jgi:Zn-dependent peptidase ImmA (M78 family)
MKKIPRSFNVLGKKIKITQKLPTKYAAKYAGWDLYGLFMYEDWTIYVDPNRSLEQQWQTLYHELLHCVFFRTGLAFDESFEDGKHEQICESVAGFIFDTFKDG